MKNNKKYLNEELNILRLIIDSFINFKDEEKHPSFGTSRHQSKERSFRIRYEESLRWTFNPRLRRNAVRSRKLESCNQACSHRRRNASVALQLESG